MNRLAIALTVVSLPACLAAVGCQDQCRSDLQGLTQRYNKLSLKNTELQNSLQAGNVENGRLMAQLNDKAAQLTAARARIAKLEKAPAPAPPRSAQGSVKFTLASDILFAPGRAILSQRGAAKVAQIAATIKKTHPHATVRVYGYTDSDPIKRSARLWKDNLDLSGNRAMAVTRHLRKLGIRAEEVETIGMGATRFLASNKTAAGKARNRRVEIVVIKRQRSSTR